LKLQLEPEEVKKKAGSSCIFSWNKLQLQRAQANLKSVTAEVAPCVG
jgi:hypothetical protein